MVKFEEGQKVRYTGDNLLLIGLNGIVTSVGESYVAVNFNDDHHVLPPRAIRPIEPNTDSPTKPDHYHSGGIDVFTYASANFTVEEVNAYHRITALKYITRAGKKDGNPFEQDIKKAIVHLEECLKGEEG